MSIAFVLAVVTASVPKNVLFAVFSGLADHISNAQLTPFLSNMHIALWCLAGVSVVGAAISAARPKYIGGQIVDPQTGDTDSVETGERQPEREPHAALS
jgi:hypothetical protein